MQSVSFNITLPSPKFIRSYTLKNMLVYNVFLGTTPSDTYVSLLTLHSEFLLEGLGNHMCFQINPHCLHARQPSTFSTILPTQHIIFLMNSVSPMDMANSKK